MKINNRDLNDRIKLPLKMIAETAVIALNASFKDECRDRGFAKEGRTF